MSRILKNYMYNMSYQLLVMIVPIFTTPYIARVLKPDGVGIYNYTYSLVSFIVLIAQLGTNLYGQREVAYVQKDYKKRSIVFSEIFVIRLFSTIIVVPIYGFIITVNREYSTILIFMFIYLLSNIFDISWFYHGLEEFKKTAIRNIIVKITGFCMVFLLVKKESDLPIYVIILATTQLFGDFSLWIGLKKRISFCPFNTLDIKKHIKPIFALFLPTAAMYIYVYIDKIILGKLSNNIQVGYYSQAEKIVKLLLTVITSLGAVMLPHVSCAIKQNKMDVVKNEVKNAFLYVLHIGMPIVVGIIIISRRFIPIFLGEDFVECVRIISILAILIVIIGLASVVGQSVLIPMKRQNVYSASIIAGASCNLVLDLALIPFLGAIGASIGTVMAELTVTSIQLFVVNRLLNIHIIEILRKSYKCFLAVGIMGVFEFILDCILLPGFLSLIIIVMGCISLYFVILLMFKEIEIRLIIEKMKGIKK